ncbi:hypothetical protein SD71_10810 [Cohnella kolymensis]|uniref:Uncharacterized protein n=1 Tax=Cohnella kolymensis TaxID=1590652 RepID=A0ABR5A541_9BACL|nr:hypothetical protein [Cohnella kolymensis]KIL35873.1 hypothetical protein SD71_10810 [Cohnella kolymensis]
MAAMTPEQITAELTRKAASGVTKASSAANQTQLDGIIKSRTDAANAVTAPPTNDTVSPTADMETKLNDAINLRKTAELDAIRRERDAALQGLNKTETQTKQNAYDNRNQADVVAMQNAQRLRQSMADMGLLNSGDNLTAQAQGNAQRQGAIGSINRDESNMLTDISERRALLNNQAAGQESGLTSRLEADRLDRMIDIQRFGIDDQFRRDQFGWQKQTDTAALTGNFNGQRTIQGQTFDRSKFESDRAYDYQVGRDKVEDQRWQKEFDYRVKQDGIQSAIAWYNAKTSRQSSNNASSNASFSKLIDIWGASGKAPAGLESFGIQPGQPYKPDSNGNPGGISKEMMSEMDGLYTGLSSNQISPSQAKAEIDGRERMGLITPQDATAMRSFVQKFSEGGSGGKPQVVQSNLAGMTGDQLLKVWETDPTGKSAGRGMYDWRSWIKDPRGQQAGVTFEMWKDQFGPRM